MTHQEQIIFLLGYIKATLEWLCHIAATYESVDLFDLLSDFQQYFNQEIHRIFINNQEKQ